MTGRADALPDLVIPVRPGDENEELRYSLRSMAENLPHGNVIIIGHYPPWAREIHHLPNTRLRTKYLTTTAAVRKACENESISDPFILSNDDFFAMQPVSGAPHWHRGPISDVIREYRLATGPYRRGMIATRNLLIERGYPHPLSYELHVPLLVHKAAMLEALELGRHLKVLHKRSVYGNLAGLGGTRHRDVKVYDPTDTVPTQQPWLSSSDASWRTLVGPVVKSVFPHPSRYER